MKRLLDTTSDSKRKRRKWTIEEKIALLDCLKEGARQSDVCRKYDINESTLRSIRHNEPQLRAYAATYANVSLESVSYVPRNLLVGRMEQLLYSWYESEKLERAKAGTNFTVSEMCAKAREIYGELEAQQLESGGDELLDEYERREFKASKGWFGKFHKHYKLDYKLTQEDTAVSEHIARHIEHIIESNEYEPQQIFSAAELSLAWRGVPIAPYKAAANDRERLGLLLCANASGDFVVKPLLVHRTLTPYCLRKQNVEDLPVFWRARARDSQRSPRVTPYLFLEWLKECFMPTVRDFLIIMELPEHCVLVLDNSLIPPAAVQQVMAELNGNGFVHIEFVKPLQHPIRGSNVLALFKCIYLKRMLAQLVQTVQQDAAHFAKVWRNFSIATAVDVIAETLEECKAEWWNSGWARLWPEIVRKQLGSSTVTEELQRVVIVANVLPATGYDSLTVADIRNHLRLEVIDVVKPKVEAFEELNDIGLFVEEPEEEEEEALPVMETVFIANDNKRHNDGETSNQVRSINKVLSLSRDLIAAVRLVNVEGKEQFAEQLNALLQPYRELKERTLQPTIRQFFQSHS